MHVALTGCFRAYWSADVHEEWMRSLLKNRPDLSRKQLERTRRLMDAALPNALVTGYEHFIASVVLPDREDRHVLAAAIQRGASVIVTFDLSHFPSQTLAGYGVEAQHPDNFVLALVEDFPDSVIEAARNHRGSLKNPPKTLDEYLAELATQGLRRTVLALQELVAGRSDVI